MNNSKIQQESNGLLSIIIIFLLTNYIYNDLNIRYMYGYITISIVALFFIVFTKTINTVSSYKMWFLMIVIPCVIFSILPNSNKGETTTAITISMLVFGVFVLCYKTNTSEIRRVMTWLEVAAIVISLYAALYTLAETIPTWLLVLL